MIREITNDQLWKIERDLIHIIKNHPGLAFLNSNKIQSFFSTNELLLNILHKRMHEIQIRYIAVDDKGIPVHIDPAAEKKEWKFLESAIGSSGGFLTGDEVAKGYDEDSAEFLNRSVKVKV